MKKHSYFGLCVPKNKKNYDNIYIHIITNRWLPISLQEFSAKPTILWSCKTPFILPYSFDMQPVSKTKIIGWA
jgi:hypothetical protein